jgi:hypothetical protein
VYTIWARIHSESNKQHAKTLNDVLLRSFIEATPLGFVVNSGVKGSRGVASMRRRVSLLIY